MSVPLPPHKQAFLDLLAARASGRDAATAGPPPVAEGMDPEDGAPATDAGAPLTFEEQPPAPSDVPPALSTLADTVAAPATQSWEDEPRADTPLMDLGADAQAQGTALALSTVANRLAAIVRDLGSLEYYDQATPLVPVMEWAVQEHNRLMSDLEQRGQQRRGEA